MLEPDIFPVDTSTLPPAATKPFIQVGVQDVQALVLAWKRTGFDVWWVNSYQFVPDTTWYFDVIFHNSTLNRSRGFVELTSSELNTTIQSQEAEGFAVHLIHSRYTEALGFRYCAVFREVSPLIEVHAYWNFSFLSHFLARYELLNSKWSIKCQSFTSVPTIISINAIYYRDRRLVYNIPFDNPEEDKPMYEGLSFVEFTSTTLTLHSDYYPEYVSSYYYPATTGTTRLSVIYQQYPSTNRHRWFRWGLNKTQVLDQIVEFSGQWDPVYIVPSKHNGIPGYIVSWFLKLL